MGYKILSKEQELHLIEEYKQGTPVKVLMERYGYKTKKSITDKIKKHYPETYQEIIKQGQNSRKNYHYELSKIGNAFDAYLVGLLLTDGYILSDRDGFGIDLTDKDCIEFLANGIGTTYSEYWDGIEGHSKKYRLVISQPGLCKQLERFGIISNKSLVVPRPKLLPEEEKFIPYIIRGIIDGDGGVSPANYGGAQFYIVSMSSTFIEWIIEILENRLFMKNINKSQNERGLWRIETADQTNILKLIALVYDRPFGMSRKYNKLRQTFRDYNKDPLLEGDRIVQTTTERA